MLDCSFKTLREYRIIQPYPHCIGLEAFIKYTKLAEKSANLMPAGTQGAMASAQPISQPSHRGAPVSGNVQQAVSPPSKEQLKSWWTKFGRKKDKPEEQGQLQGHDNLGAWPFSLCARVLKWEKLTSAQHQQIAASLAFRFLRVSSTRMSPSLSQMSKARASSMAMFQSLLQNAVSS